MCTYNYTVTVAYLIKEKKKALLFKASKMKCKRSYELSYVDPISF